MTIKSAGATKYTEKKSPGLINREAVHTCIQFSLQLGKKIKKMYHSEWKYNKYLFLCNLVTIFLNKNKKYIVTEFCLTKIWKHKKVSVNKAEHSLK